MSASAVAKAIGSNQTKGSAVEGARRTFTEAELDKALDVLAAPPEKADELRVRDRAVLGVLVGTIEEHIRPTLD